MRLSVSRQAKPPVSRSPRPLIDPDPDPDTDTDSDPDPDSDREADHCSSIFHLRDCKEHFFSLLSSTPPNQEHLKIRLEIEARGGDGGGMQRRSRKHQPSLARAEWVLIGVILLWYALTLFWFRGGLDWTGHRISTVLGLVALGVLLSGGRWSAGRGPSTGSGQDRGFGVSEEKRTAAPGPLRGLLRFPPFWLGLFVLGYMVIQILNPAWEYFSMGGGEAFMLPLEPISWLPSGVTVHVTADNNPFNGFLQVALPWLLFCLVAIGLKGPPQRRERRSARSRSDLQRTDARWVLANGFLILTGLWSLMALWHYHTGMTHLYGFIDIGRNNVPPYWGSLRNPRHGGFIQMLGTVLALALAFRELRKGEVAMRSGLPWFYFGVAAFFTYATVQTLSRGSNGLTVLLWFFTLGVGLLWGWRSRIKGVIPAMLTFFALFLIGAGSFLYLNLQNPDNRDFKRVYAKAVGQWQGEGDVSRNILNRVGWRMHEANALKGTGIGSFGLLYRQYIEPGEERIAQQQRGWVRDPQTNRILTDPETGQRIPNYTPFQFWHAHNDVLQFLIELGWIGFTPLLLLFAYPFGASALHALRGAIRQTEAGKQEGRRKRGEGPRRDFAPENAILLFGILLVALASGFDFPLRTPAFGLFFGLIAALALPRCGRMKERG